MKLAHEEETTQASEERKNGKHSYVAVKVWSEPMQAFICVVADEEDAKVFRINGLKDIIYTADEIQELNCMDSDSLKTLRTILFDD